MYISILLMHSSIPAIIPFVLIKRWYVEFVMTLYVQMMVCETRSKSYPDSKVHGANMGPIWGRQDPGGPHVGPMNVDIWVAAGDQAITLVIDTFWNCNGVNGVEFYRSVAQRKYRHTQVFCSEY